MANSEPEVETLPRCEVEEMQVEAIPGKTQVLAGAKNTTQMVVRICTPKADAVAAARPPVHVVCVMDCSSSMQGERIVYAKKAVCKLVKHLSARDILHVVTYEDTARIVFRNGDLSDTGKEGLRQQIEAVRAGGQTNLFSGLELAASLLGAPPLENNTSPPDSKSGGKLASSSQVAVKEDGLLRRILLFSDGRVNAGTKNPQVIQQKVGVWATMGISTGSFGIGADFDEPLMRGIATSGQGRYQFLGSEKDIPKLVSKAVHQLIDIYASDATLEIRGWEHTAVTCVSGGHDDADDADAGTSAGFVHLGDLHSDSVRSVLVEMDIAPPGNAECGQAFDSAEWILACQRNGSPVSISGKVQLLVTRDRASLDEEASTVVQIMFAIRRATDMEREIAECLSRCDREKARSIKAQQLTILESALDAGERRQRSQRSHGDIGKDLELLGAVLERARQAATRLEADNVDAELMARQCWQDRDDMSCGSFTGLQNRCDSSAGGSFHGDTSPGQRYRFWDDAPDSPSGGSYSGSYGDIRLLDQRRARPWTRVKGCFRSIFARRGRARSARSRARARLIS